MKSIKLIINELGAIRESSIEIKPLMVLSGESGLGKSYLAILIHYVYKILTELRLQGFFLEHKWDYETLSQVNSESGQISFDTSSVLSWINKDVDEYMKTTIGNQQLKIDVKIELPIESKKLSLSYRTEMMGLVGKEELFLVFQLDGINGRAYRISADSKNIGTIPWTFILQNYLCETVLGNDAINQTMALVPGRGGLLNIPLTIQEKVKGEDSIYTEFLKDWDIVRSMSPKKNDNKQLLKTLRGINGGQIALDGDQNLVYKMDLGQELPITAAASSVKELAPLDMLLSKYPANGLSILFEEPEAHLHPTKQISIADFIVQVINAGAHVQITTHSDYFLRRINDRIILHKINELNNEIYEQVINEYRYSNLTINPSLISAYVLLRNSDGDVEVKQQNAEEGIPYDTFSSVLEDGIGHSLDIQMKYSMLKHDTK
jgi:predicted ATPase